MTVPVVHVSAVMSAILLWATSSSEGASVVGGDEVAAKSAQALEKYEAGDFEGALRLYRNVLVEEPDSDPLRFNVGDALYKAGDIEGALKEFLGSASSDDMALQGQSWYNAGNAHLGLQQYGEAIKAYKEALARLPKDGDAKANLELARQLMVAQQQPQKDGDGRDDETEEQAGEEQMQQPQDSDGAQPEPNKEAEDKKESNQQDASAGDETDRAQSQQRESSIGTEEAERLLDALAADELDAQHRRIRFKPSKLAKDW